MVWYSKIWVKICLIVITAGSVASVYAYFVFFQPTASPMASVTYESLCWSIELDKSEFHYGENMTIKFRVENTGNETVTVHRSSPGWWHPNYTETSYHNVHAPSYKLEREFHFGFSVAHTNGTEFFRIGRGFLGYSYDLDIDPGGWLEQTIIARTIDVPGDLMSHTYFIPVQKGTYQIKGFFRYYVDQLPFITLETASVTFVIQQQFVASKFFFCPSSTLRISGLLH